jgi:purine-binding chemotaxis protein CheW
MSPATSEPTAPGSAAGADCYLTFKLGHDSYGLPVLRVREIIRRTDITPVPLMPAHVKGVINLRGKITPVMDLRRRLDLGVTVITDRTCIIVVQLSRSNRVPSLLGLMVDVVAEVVPITAANVAAPPALGGDGQPDFILALARVRNSLTTLLDLDKLLAMETGAHQSTRSDPA